jgi:hypothetical protein
VTDIERPEGVSRRCPVAKVREGTRGDYNVSIWLPTLAEAQAIATMVNERLRQREAEDAAP